MTMNTLKMLLLSTLVILFTACNSSDSEDEKGVSQAFPIAKIDVTRTSNTEEPDVLFPEGQSIRFSAEGSTDPDGSIVSYKWTEGIKELSEIPVFDTTTLSIGKHVITLTVTDNDGNTNSTEVEVKVFAASATPPPPEEESQAQCLEAAGYGTVTLNNTQVWLDKNLGAPDVGAIGDYYQWGRTADGHERLSSDITPVQVATLTAGHGDFIVTSRWTTADLSLVEWDTAGGTNQVCPCGFIVPTHADYLAMKSVDHSTLKFPTAPGTGIRVYTWGYITNDWASYHWLSDVVHTGFYTNGGTAVLSGQLSEAGANVRCIDPSSRLPY